MASRPVTKALIPAAGRGTRFLPFTKAVPKELAPLVTTPALELVIGEAAAKGITDVIVVLSAGKSAISDYFSHDTELEAALEAKGDEGGLASIRRPAELANVSYVEQASPRGLGDAVHHGEQFVGDEPFAVLLPDDLIDAEDELLGQMLDLQAEKGGIVLGLIDVPREEIRKYGCAVPAPGSDSTDDIVQIVDLVEKPAPDEAPSTLAVIGRYVLPPEIFAALRTTQPGSGGEIQLTDAMRTLAESGTPVHGVVFRGRRYDTGDRLEYVKAVVQVALRHPEVGTDFGLWLRDYVSKLD
ncbi:MAG: UTP--glucose-phosphate uridylyltransferase [Pseudonocardiales bacterium]|jgi:UTP--glucose-1-phosphate uridylyltransferase|nr:UTP--glucose-phosphate uridylyltransferase [Pseudonocardiales bacterium]